jgi:CubicO group peptidase (beta-lactamase class C family)
MNDLLAAVKMFLNGGYLLAPAINLALEPRAPMASGRIGLAWFTPTDAEWSWHNGATFGYTSYLGISRAKRSVVVIVCNKALPSEVTELGHKLMRLATQGEGTHDAG